VLTSEIPHPPLSAAETPNVTRFRGAGMRLIRAGSMLRKPAKRARSEAEPSEAERSRTGQSKM
jgi:hypothetical protein